MRPQGAQVSGRSAKNKTNHRYRRLLRACCQRPRGRAAEQGDELAPLHCPMPPVLSTERIAHLSYGRRLLRRGISTQLMTAVGHTRPWRHVRVESALPPTSDIGWRGWHGRKVPTPAVSSRSKYQAYSITSSAVASSVGGTVRPTPSRYLMLITSSNVIGCITVKVGGRSSP